MTHFDAVTVSTARLERTEPSVAAVVNMANMKGISTVDVHPLPELMNRRRDYVPKPPSF